MNLSIFLVDSGEFYSIPIPAFGRMKEIKPLPLPCAFRAPSAYNCMMDEVGKEEMERLARLGIPPATIFQPGDVVEAMIVPPFDAEERTRFQICNIKRNGVTLAEICDNELIKNFIIPPKTRILQPPKGRRYLYRQQFNQQSYDSSSD